jgi:hypothetical protein
LVLRKAINLTQVPALILGLKVPVSLPVVGVAVAEVGIQPLALGLSLDRDHLKTPTIILPRLAESGIAIPPPLNPGQDDRPLAALEIGGIEWEWDAIDNGFSSQ